MPTPDQTRLVEDRARPRMMELWWALRPLTSVVRFMQSGAHPDDEDSGMLAALAFRDGINLSYTCSTRGEGGQNDIGTETGADLGALRTREMERACDVLGMRMYWLSESPDDPITDFGFSKCGVETLGRWGHDRTMARFVEVVRTERPDVLCPTFLDVPGQHGHHRAMTQAAHEVMAAAADAGFPSNLPPWQVKKLYLPARSGAGQAYDDAEPPPAATLVIDGSGRDPVSGWNWERIGQQSRAYHRTQGMGRWVPPSQGGNWPLHLAETHVPGPDEWLWSGLFRTVGDLAQAPGAGPIAKDLRRAQAAIEAALTSFPAMEHVAEAADQALVALRQARSACPEEASHEILHRLDAKEVQLGHVLRLALGVEARARVDNFFLSPGSRTVLAVEEDPGTADALRLTMDTPSGWLVADGVLEVGEDAAPTDPYRAAYDPADPPAPALRLEISKGETSVFARLPFEAAPMVLPKRVASVSPDALVVNLSHPPERVTVTLKGIWPDEGAASLDPPEGWSSEPGADGETLNLPEKLAEGLYSSAVLVNGAPAFITRRILYPHVAPTVRACPAELRVRVLTAEIPDARIGYAGAGSDRVGQWLAALGADVTDLTDEDLVSDAALARFDTIVVGIFAMRFRPALYGAVARLHRWTEAGGTLVTLYHRPWDNWDPDHVPPRRLEIGQPSLRWRVTDEKAEVRHLADHPILSEPNRIGPEDWLGWVKERGLYFAKSWDEAYSPLLEMADPDEAPHRGALLVSDVGRGRHVHTSLILHHQMENLVPGAFRLMANLVAARR